MDLGDILTRERVIACLRAKTKKQVLQDLSEQAAELTGLVGRQIFESLLQRERLGSTGLGRGIAIPHVKLAGLDRIQCIFARLEHPVEFEAPDGEPVDLVFMLMAPEHASGDHLKALAKISRLLHEPSALERLRSARDAAALFTLLTAAPTSHAA
ncbi:MAG: PTS IIA-like nitrogen regulatory protein PtsN [Hyphomicrobiaceae bacterium]